ncbi:MAG: glutathione S-transferase family protein [Pseudomonadota bacterium]
MTKPSLYCFSMPTFNSAKALLAGEEAGVDYDIVFLDANTAEHRQEAHLGRHPLGKIPALEHGTLRLFESLAIARYFDALAGGPLSSSDPAIDARINQWADFTVNHVGRAVGMLYLEEFLKPTFRGREPDPDVVAGALSQLERELPVLDQALADSEFFGGEHYSLADVVVLAYLLDQHKLSLSTDPYPNLARWYTAALARPATERALARNRGDAVA